MFTDNEIDLEMLEDLMSTEQGVQDLKELGVTVGMKNKLAKAFAARNKGGSGDGVASVMVATTPAVAVPAATLPAATLPAAVAGSARQKLGNFLRPNFLRTWFPDSDSRKDH